MLNLDRRQIILDKILDIILNLVDEIETASPGDLGRLTGEAAEPQPEEPEQSDYTSPEDTQPS